MDEKQLFERYGRLVTQAELVQGQINSIKREIQNILNRSQNGQPSNSDADKRNERSIAPGDSDKPVAKSGDKG